MLSWHVREIIWVSKYGHVKICASQRLMITHDPWKDTWSSSFQSYHPTLTSREGKYCDATKQFLSLDDRRWAITSPERTYFMLPVSLCYSYSLSYPNSTVSYSCIFLTLSFFLSFYRSKIMDCLNRSTETLSIFFPSDLKSN